jgi:hypothetical protein
MKDISMKEFAARSPRVPQDGISQCTGVLQSPLCQTEIKEIRAELGEVIKKLRGFSVEMNSAISRIKEGKMWLGQELGRLGSEDLNAKRDSEELKQENTA